MTADFILLEKRSKVNNKTYDSPNMSMKQEGEKSGRKNIEEREIGVSGSKTGKINAMH